MTHPDADQPRRFEVRVHRDGDLISSEWSADIEDADSFMEEWSEAHPGDRVSVDDRSVDHTAWEDAEADTALADDRPHGTAGSERVEY